MKKIDDERMYRIQSEPSHFWTGRLQDGTQVMMRVDGYDLISINFDAEGNHTGILSKKLSQTTLLAEQESIRDSTWYRFNGDWEELYRWGAELGVTEQMISIKKFSLPEQELRIIDIPLYYQEMSDRGDGLDDDILEDIRYWKGENDFVLVWSQDYHIDKDGKVVST